MRRKKSKETYLAVLIRAADAHPNWEVIADENGIPFAVRKKDKTAPGPASPKELAEWFVETFPEEAADILSGDAPQTESHFVSDYFPIGMGIGSSDQHSQISLL